MSEVRDGRVDPFDGWLANSPMFLPKEPWSFELTELLARLVRAVR